jgi:2,4-dienoyl-CoA reductase (NADPH2)
VNPRAAHETTLRLLPTRAVKRVAVVGAGLAGLAAATTLAQRGHTVDLFEADSEIGGQFTLARRMPGKEEFAETIRYFVRQIELTGVKLHLDTQASAGDLINGGYDEVVLATGVTPRTPAIPGVDGPNVLSNVDVVLHGAPVGERVAVVGAGGIGFDISEFLTTTHSTTLDLDAWKREWGVADPGIGTRWPDETAAGAIAAHGVPAAGQVLAGRSRTRQDHRLGAPRGAEEQERRDDRRGQRQDRRSWTAHLIR